MFQVNIYIVSIISGMSVLVVTCFSLFVIVEAETYRFGFLF